MVWVESWSVRSRRWSVVTCTTDHDRPSPSAMASDPAIASRQLSSGFGAGLLPGCTLLLTSTAAALRSLNTPDVTTSSPGFTPEITPT